MKKQLITLCAALLSASFFMSMTAAAQDLKINDKEYFERQGVNVLVYSNLFSGGFNDEKNSGIELILQATSLLVFSSVSQTTSRTTTIGHSFGVRMKVPLPTTQVTSTSVTLFRTLLRNKATVPDMLMSGKSLFT